MFRFANVVRSHQRWTVIPEFIQKTPEDPTELDILDDGRQEKSYMHLPECVAAMQHVIEHADAPYNCCNLETETRTPVTEIADIVIDELDGSSAYSYTGGDRSWTGDVPRMRLLNQRVSVFGWEPSLSIHEAIRQAVHELIDKLAAQSEM